MGGVAVPSARAEVERNTMTAGPILMDVSRLLWRSHRAAPGGIDRVELALAEALLARDLPVHFVFTDTGRLIALSPESGSRLVTETADRWRGTDDDWGTQRVMGYLRGEDLFPDMRAAFRDGHLGLRELGEWASSLFRYARFRRLRLTKAERAAATYINVSHRNLDQTRLLRSLGGIGRRIAYIHDDIPLRGKGLSSPGLTVAFQRMFQNVARAGFEIMTNSDTSANRIAETASRMGLVMARAVVVRPPLPEVFMHSAPRIGTERPFFVTTGLFTKRKNLGVLVEAAVLAERFSGVVNFDIIFVGAPGRDMRQVLAGWSRRPERIRLLRGERLSDYAYWRLLGASCGLLAPSLDEGYDYPVHEALASHVRVMASDIGVHRECLARSADLLSPHDATAWAHVLAEAAQNHAPGLRRNPARQDLRTPSTVADLLRYVVSAPDA